MENPTISPHHNFSRVEKERLIRSASSQEDAIRRFFKDHPTAKFTYYEILQFFGWDKDSVKRSISNLSNSKPSGPWIDENKQPPLLKLPEKRLNPKSGIRIHLYQWNSQYGKRAPVKQEELFTAQKYGV